MAVASHVSMLMYVRTRELLPVKLDDTWEVAYMLFGRKSIFVMCGVFFANAYIICVVCYVWAMETICAIFYGWVSARETGYENAPGWQKFVCDRSKMLIIVGVVSLTWIFQKEREGFSPYSIFMRLLIFLVGIYYEMFFGNSLH